MKEIQLSNNGKIVLIDDEDFELVSLFRWYENDGYARTAVCIDKKIYRILLHRLIMNAKPTERLDHSNGNRLDNQKRNLRFCTNGQNAMNRGKKVGTSSRYKGVDWFPSVNKWRARIVINQNKVLLGYFTCENEAGNAYNKKASELFGEYAKPNLVVTS